LGWQVSPLLLLSHPVHPAAVFGSTQSAEPPPELEELEELELEPEDDVDEPELELDEPELEPEELDEPELELEPELEPELDPEELDELDEPELLDVDEPPLDPEELDDPELVAAPPELDDDPVPPSVWVAAVPGRPSSPGSSGPPLAQALAAVTRMTSVVAKVPLFTRTRCPPLVPAQRRPRNDSRHRSATLEPCTALCFVSDTA
jgi:pilus assembly protein FimV